LYVGLLSTTASQSNLHHEASTNFVAVSRASAERSSLVQPSLEKAAAGKQPVAMVNSTMNFYPRNQRFPVA